MSSIPRSDWDWRVPDPDPDRHRRREEEERAARWHAEQAASRNGVVHGGGAGSGDYIFGRLIFGGMQVFLWALIAVMFLPFLLVYFFWNRVGGMGKVGLVLLGFFLWYPWIFGIGLLARWAGGGA